MELRGAFEAPHSHRLVDRVERYIKCVAGAFIASGIARYYYARISSVPVVMIEGNSDRLHLDASVGALAAGTVFGVPEDLNEIKGPAKTKIFTNALTSTLKRVAYLIPSKDPRHQPYGAPRCCMRTP